MRLSIEIPEAVARQLRVVAAAQDCSIGDLVQEMCFRRARAIKVDQLTQLWMLNLTDKEIAEEMGIPKSNVSSRRARRQLPANR